jgi:predicted Zn-dependent protease
VALVIAVVSLATYYGSSSKNPITGEVQHIDMSVDQEIALGLQAAPEMAAQFGGLDNDGTAQKLVDEIGGEVVRKSRAGDSPYKFEFHALADNQTINAFALPGGQVFVTRGLLLKLRSRGQLAGVLGHEVGHVVARHSAEQIAKARLTQGLSGAAVIATYDPGNPRSRASAGVAVLIAQLVNLRFSRDDELEADRLGVDFMSESGYDPRAMIEVMEILKQASSGGREPEFFATHPNPDHRIDQLKQIIREKFPQGVPATLTQ